MVARGATLDPAVIEAAQRLGSATVHEAAGRIGALPARLTAISGTQIVAGSAFPVACPKSDNLWLHHAVYAARSGDMLVVAVDGPEEHGYWGEILAVAAQQRGIAGLVIDGGVRDTVRLGELGFPVFARSRSIRGTSKDPRKCGSLGQPVRIGSVTIRTDDLVIADADGVVIIPSDRANAAVAAGQSREVDEARYIDQLRRGASTLEIYGLPDVG